MTRTELLQEIRKMRFGEAYEGWNTGRLTQAEAAQVLGMCERSFRRYLARYEAEGPVPTYEKRGAHRTRRERSALPGVMILGVVQQQNEASGKRAVFEQSNQKNAGGIPY